MHVLLTHRLNVLVWKITSEIEYNNKTFKSNKSRCKESLTIFKQICQLCCSPLLNRIPGPSKCECVCMKDRESALRLAAQGACLNRLWLTHTVMMWPEGPWLPSTHMHTNTRTCIHTRTLNRLHQASYPQ